MSTLRWYSENRPPIEKGWYQVKRADGSLCVRSYGNRLWWIPLSDGWLSGLPPGFKWRGPIAPMGADKDRPPYEEAQEVERAWQAKTASGLPHGAPEARRALASPNQSNTES